MSEAGKHASHRDHGSSDATTAVAALVITGVVIASSLLFGDLINSGKGGAADRAMSNAGHAGPDEPSTAYASDPRIPAATSQVGETRRRDNSDTTLLQVRKVLAPADRSAPSGQEWFGIRATTCMHADARPSGGVPWSSWTVVTRDGASYAGRRVPWENFPPQQYSTTGVPGGRCNVGWVLVMVPRGTFRDVETVIFQPDSPEPLEWEV